MPRYRYSQTITVQRPGGVDRFNQPLPGSVHTIDDVVIYPTSAGRPSTENTDYQDTVITGYTLLPPPGADIRPTDRVHLPSDPDDDNFDWAVQGDVGDYLHPMTGWRPGGIVLLERVTG